MNRAHITASAFLIAVTVFLGAFSPSSEAQTPTLRCSDFDTQADAQRQWDAQGGRSGKLVTTDPDGDGRVCESLPGKAGPDKGTCTKTRKVVVVRLSARKYPNVTDHLLDVIRAKRAPRVLHIDRKGAEANRDQSIGNWERTKGHLFSKAQRKGMDRDEFAPAISREGGKYRGRYADVRLVPSAENRSAGSSMGLQLRRWCNGTAFRIAVTR